MARRKGQQELAAKAEKIGKPSTEMQPETI
jgi:hypothetical protein